MAEYARRHTQIVAVNPGSLESHQTWADEFQFPFPICVDHESKVATAYGSLKPEGGIQRSVILVDKQGRVAWAIEGRPETEAVLAAFDEIVGRS